MSTLLAVIPAVSGPFGATGWGFIGQMAPPALTAAPLAVLRSPGWLPAGVNDVLFASHWYWWLAIGAAVLTLLWLGNARQQRRLIAAGLASGLVLLVWVLLAALVVTPAERLYAAHEAILKAADAGRSKDIARYLAPSFTWGPFDKPSMVASIQHALDTYHVRSNIERYYKATVSGPDGDSQINVLTQTDQGPVVTKWFLQWTDQAGGDWQITAVQHASFGSGDQQFELGPQLVPTFK